MQFIKCNYCGAVVPLEKESYVGVINEKRIYMDMGEEKEIRVDLCLDCYKSRKEEIDNIYLKYAFPRKRRKKSK